MALRCFNFNVLRTSFTTWRNVSTQISRHKLTVQPLLSTIICKNDWIWQQNTPINIPQLPYINNIPGDKNVILPILPLLDPNKYLTIIKEPVSSNDISKEAAKLIVIRRRKMRRHKLRKLRKRLKFERAKIRQRRELRKEKIFQAELITQIKEAEKFSAEEYVTEKIKQAKDIPIPRFWKGRRLPEFIIRQKLGLPPK